MKVVALVVLAVVAQAAHVPRDTQTLVELEGAACVNCPYGQVQTVACKSGGSANCQCAPGFWGTLGEFRLGQGSCNRCARNTYQNQPGKDGCEACAAGSTRSVSEDPTRCVCEPGFGDDGGACAACANNFFKSHRGNEACTPCDACPMGQDVAEACTASQNTKCKCVAGFFGPGNPFIAGTQACEPCAEGTFQSEDNASECDACDQCGAGEEETAACNPIANTQCQCSRGYAGHGGSFNADLAPCTQCTGNKYQDAPGKDSCKDCSTCTDTEGQVHASACTSSQDTKCKCAAGFSGHLGSFVNGDAQCSPCADGSYQPSEGKDSCTDCTACPSGSVQTDGCSSTKNNVCQCAAGHAGHDGDFEAHDGSCTACGADTYQNEQGQANCKDCPEHSTRAAGADHNSCSCLQGYTGEGTQENGCSRCPANTYKSEIGSQGCTACPALSSSPEGSEAIEDCQCDSNAVRNGDSCERIFFRSGLIEEISLNAREFSYSSISNPVVFVSPLTYNGGHIAVVRVDAGDNKYTAKIAEPSCLDGVHPAKEDMHWLVMERGTHTYGGATIAAFTQDDITVESITDVNFDAGTFSATPTCFSYIQSNSNNDMFLSTRIVSTSATKLQVIIEPDEKTKKQTSSWPNKETVGFLCVENGKTELDGLFGKFTVTTVNTSNGETTRAYSASVGADHAFAHMISRNGPNPAIVRHTTYSNGNLGFRLQEDTCNDSETWHLAETVAVLGFPTY